MRMTAGDEVGLAGLDVAVGLGVHDLALLLQVAQGALDFLLLIGGQVQTAQEFCEGERGTIPSPQ